MCSSDENSENFQSQSHPSPIKILKYQSQSHPSPIPNPKTLKYRIKQRK